MGGRNPSSPNPNSPAASSHIFIFSLVVGLAIASRFTKVCLSQQTPTNQTRSTRTQRLMDGQKSTSAKERSEWNEE